MTNGRYPAATAVVAAALTAVLVFTPLRFTVRSIELRVSLETAQALIAGLAALLLYGRYRRRGLWGDLLSAYALGLFSATSLLLVLLPALARPDPGGRLDRFDTWAPLLARTVGAVALAAAAVARPRWSSLRHGAALLAMSLAATIGVVAITVAATIRWLPPVVQEAVEREGVQRPNLDAPAALLAAQLFLLAVFAAAAAGFARQSERDPNPLTTALACGCVLAAFARLNFFLYPSIYTDVVHVGDALRLLFFLVLLAGAAAEINRFWRLEADAVAARERQRIARELHDGLAQELAFIRSHTAALASGASPPGVTPLVAEAAQRAIAESRRVVDALRTDRPVSVEDVLRDAVGEVAVWAGTTVDVCVDRGAWVPATAQPQLGELVRRAAATAVRSRAASQIWVRLEVSGRRTVLTVEDDGTASDDRAGGLLGVEELSGWLATPGAVAATGAAADGRTRLQFVLPWRPTRREQATEER